MKRLAATLAIAASLIAQQPRIEKADLETRTIVTGLEAALRSILAAQSSPAWVAYAVPMIPGEHNLCCWDDNQPGCFLEPHTSARMATTSTNETLKLEGPTHFVVLLRIENHEVGKIRMVTPECGLDAGGLPFIWLQGANPRESVPFLISLATAGDATRKQQRRSNAAIAAIAMHADPAADQALDTLASPSHSEQQRRQAIFWLGSARQRHGFEVVSRILKEDPSEKIREQAVFALMENQDPEAVNAVIRTAHNDKSAHVRGQALFWLAQRAGQKVAATAISNAIANDPEVEVKRRAVFSLTQIPGGDGVPLLIQVARENQNFALRKQAIFWLGQSKDPRALAFFEEVLK